MRTRHKFPDAKFVQSCYTIGGNNDGTSQFGRARSQQRESETGRRVQGIAGLYNSCSIHCQTLHPGVSRYADQIKESVSDFLIFQAVAEEQKIKVTDDDVSNYFGGDALSVKQAKAYYGEAYLNQNVLYEKVYTWLVDHASIV